MRRRAIVAMVAGAAALLACEGGPGAPTAADRGAPALGIARATPLVALVDIELARASRTSIDPCWLVNRGIFQADSRSGQFTAEFTYTYPSRGVMVTRTFTMPVHLGVVEEDERNTDRASYVELMSGFDVGDAFPDRGAEVVGRLVLVRTEGATRAIVGESSLAKRP